MVGVMDSFGVMGRVRVGIRVKPVCSAACKTIKTKVTCYSVKLRDRVLCAGKYISISITISISKRYK